MTSRTLGQLARYGAVGLGSNAVLYLAYLGLTALGLGHKLAATLLYGVGVAQSYLLNRAWTFRHAGDPRRSFARYWAAYAIGYLMMLALLALFVDALGFPHQLVQGGLIFAVAGVLFLLQKYWVFGREPGASREERPRAGSGSAGA